MKTKKHKPTRDQFNIFRQICNLIPPHLVPKLARETGAQEKSRSLSCWSHVVSLIYSQLTHAIGLNDVCDSLRLHSGPLASVRGATPPSRNGLSHANKARPAQMAEKLFWSVLDHLGNQSPGFIRGKNPGYLKRFKCPIHIVDSTVIELIASNMDWAKHRRRKAAAKTHMRLSLQSFLPQCVIIDTAKEHDNLRARELCAGLQAGEIVVFDKAYLDFSHLRDLDERDVFWVSRAKENMAYEVESDLPLKEGGNILEDQLITLNHGTDKSPEVLRRVKAKVEVDGKEREMVFLTNNLTWSPQSVANLYKSRWQIEVFFKQLKQTLQVADFLGNNANAVRWQVWMALLTYVLLRYLGFVSNWSHSFTRLFTIVRAVLWRKVELFGLLRGYGTAGGHFRHLATPQQAYFAGF